MENIESAATALANSMVVDESAAANAEDVLAQQLMTEPEGSAQSNPQGNPEDNPEGEAAQEGQQADNTAGEAQVEGKTQESQPTPEEARQTEIRDGIRALFDAGWTAELLGSFAEDEQARADVAAGKSVSAAANAYAMRVLVAGGAQKARSKSGVPSIRKAAASDAKPVKSIEDMSDAEFDAFSRKAKELANEGKKVRM